MKTTSFNSILNLKALLFIFFLSQDLFSQTIIMNEVSNGPSGNKEYVEFVVIDTAITYDCSGTTPPGIDIRGWIFDDNSGYHGAGGVAAGALRFAFDPLWSNLPLGTIILIYNDADINPAIPPVDISMVDGNCRLVVPISSSLFETNLTTPGAVACSYPSSGWTPGGLWSSTLLANTGDCARIVNLAGCEVFSVCWATCSTSPLIYFSSTGSGTDNVWYFNNGDPNDQTNWSEGCADASSCGTDEQTPGSANNALNAAYISQFNNGCSPITPISSSIGSFTNATCACDGTATANCSGSIAGYTYVWYDALFVPIGQTSSTATGLCAGTYHVIATSSIGCSDTSTVTITSTGVTPTVSIVPSTISICNGSTTTLTASGALTYAWSPATNLSATTGSVVDANPTSSTTYIVTGTNASGCSDTASVTVTINPLPVVTITPVSAVCEGDLPFLVNSTPSGGSWSGTGISSGGLFTPSGLGGTSQVITYTFTDLNGCTNTASFTMVVNSSAPINISVVPSVCENTLPFMLTATPSGGVWTGSGVSSGGLFDPTGLGGVGSTVTYTTPGSCGSSSSISIVVNSLPIITITPVPALCENGATINVSASPVGGTWTGTGISAGGVFDPFGLGGTSPLVTYTFTDINGCIGAGSTSINVSTLPVITISAPDTLCESSSPVNLTATPLGGTWSGIGITNPSLGSFDPGVAGSGNIIITYTATSGACTASTTQNITVIATSTFTIVPLGPLNFCEGNSVELLVIGSGGNTVTWSNGYVGDTLLVTSPGNYSATYISTCGVVSSNVLTTTVFDVNPSFMLDPYQGQAPLIVNMDNTTPNTLSYTWVIGDSIYNLNVDTSVYFSEPGTYEITLYVINTNGCVDSLTQTVIVYGEYGLVIPNVFTPNGDNYNDGFILTAAGIMNLEARIYNRWGQLMNTYESDLVEDGRVQVWDGKTNNNMASDGTYAYVITTKGFDTIEKVFHGFVTLITK